MVVTIVTIKFVSDWTKATNFIMHCEDGGKSEEVGESRKINVKTFLTTKNCNKND